MTDKQEAAVWMLLCQLFPFTEAHHGDCIGADERFHGLAYEVGGAECKRVGHPPINETYRAFCDFDETREPKDYIARNRDIVNETDILIAAPATMTQPASLKGEGTWSTVVYARPKGKPVYVVLPDGTVQPENVENRNLTF